MIRHYLAAREAAASAQIVQQSFTKAGLYPVNPSIFTAKDYAPNQNTSMHLAVPTSFPTTDTPGTHLTLCSAHESHADNDEAPSTIREQLASFAYNLRNSINDEKVKSKFHSINDKARLEQLDDTIKKTISWLTDKSEPIKGGYEECWWILKQMSNPIMQWFGPETHIDESINLLEESESDEKDNSSDEDENVPIELTSSHSGASSENAEVYSHTQERSILTCSGKEQESWGRGAELQLIAGIDGVQHSQGSPTEDSLVLTTLTTSAVHASVESPPNGTDDTPNATTENTGTEAECYSLPSSSARVGLKRKRTFTRLCDANAQIEKLDATVEKRDATIESLKKQVKEANSSAQEMRVHAIFSQREYEKLQKKISTSTKKKKRRFNPKATTLTKGEGLQIVKEVERRKQEKKDKEAARKEQSEQRAKERETARTAAAASGTFFGALSSKSKPDLEDIAAALGLPFDSMKAELTRTIRDHLDHHPELADNERFLGLFTSIRRRAPLGTITNTASLPQQQQQQQIHTSFYMPFPPMDYQFYPSPVIDPALQPFLPPPPSHATAEQSRQA